MTYEKLEKSSSFFDGPNEVPTGGLRFPAEQAPAGNFFYDYYFSVLACPILRVDQNFGQENYFRRRRDTIIAVSYILKSQ